MSEVTALLMRPMEMMRTGDNQLVFLINGRLRPRPRSTLTATTARAPT